MEWQRVGFAPNMAGDDRNGTEFPHGAGIAEDDSVEKRPLDVGEGYAQERLPTRGTEAQRGVFLIITLCLHKRDEFARHEGERHENGGERHAWNRENDLDVMLSQPGAEQAVCAEHEHVNKSGNHWRYCKRKVN